MPRPPEFYTREWRGVRLPLEGKALLCPGGLFRRFLPLNIRYLAGGACRRPYIHERCLPPPLQGRTGLLSKNSAPAGILRLARVFFSASGFWEDVAVSRQFSFSVSGDDNGRFLGGRKRSPSETQLILPIAVIHGHARKVPIIRDVAVAHTVSLIDQKDTCN